jgi:hypothetical protein
LVLKLELLHNFIELALRSADLLLEQFDTFLQVPRMSRIGHSLLAYAVVKFLGEIERHKQSARAEACLLANGNWTTGTVHLDWLCARPHASRLALKSVQKFYFGHAHRLEEPTARMNGRGRLVDLSSISTSLYRD